MRTRRVLVLTHAPWEGPGLVADALADLPLERRSVVDDDAPDLPAPRHLAGLVVMGGPQGADDDDRHPGLAAERRLLAEAVAADVPVLGICLGMQLLAVALGARLHRGHGTEIGFGRVEVLASDPVIDALGPGPDVLHWHSDAVDLPGGARALAATPATPVQAFRAGAALGLQFHVEVGSRLLASWLRTPAMTTGLTPPAVARLHVDGSRVLPTLERRARTALAAFATDVRERS